MQLSHLLFIILTFTWAKKYWGRCKEFCISVWSAAGRALCVLCSYMGFVMKSILPKARYPSACRSPASSGLAVPAEDQYRGTEGDRAQTDTPGTANMLAVLTAQGVKLHTSSCSLSISGLLEVFSQLVCPIPFWMFLFPCVGCTLKRKTWIYATLFPEIQEKEMGLLNKIALIWEFLRAGCAVWQRLPLLWAELPVQRGCLWGAPCRAGGWSGSWQGKCKVCSELCSWEPREQPRLLHGLAFCSGTDCSSNGAELETAWVKNFPLVKTRALLPSQRRLTSREGHGCWRHSTAQYLIDIHSQGCVSCPSCGCCSSACNSHRYSQWGLCRQVCLWPLKEAAQIFRRDFLYVVTAIPKQQKYSM